MFWTKVHGVKIMKYARLWNIFVIKLLSSWGREPGTRLMSNYSNCKVKMHVKRTEQILAVRSAVAAAVLLLYFIEMQRKVALLMHYSDLFYIWQNLERNQQGWKIPRIKRERTQQQYCHWTGWYLRILRIQLGPRHEQPRAAETSRPAENVECGSTIFCSLHVPESGLKFLILIKVYDYTLCPLYSSRHPTIVKTSTKRSFQSAQPSHKNDNSLKTTLVQCRPAGRRSM